MLKSIFVLFICILAGCGSSVTQNSDTVLQNRNSTKSQQSETTNLVEQKIDSELTLKMERISWSERTVYKLEIQPNGKVIFEGSEFTNIKDKVEGKLEKEKMKQLLIEIEKSKVFSLDDAYNYEFSNCPVVVSDVGRMRLYLKVNGREKFIKHDLGCEDDSYEKFPQPLVELEDKIEEIVNIRRWTGDWESKT